MLRSMRYGEADRILHLYTPQRGRVSAIAKGVRARASRASAAGWSRSSAWTLVLYEGRSDLLTVTSAETLAGHRRLRERRAGARRRRARLRRRRRACSTTASRTPASTTCSPTSSRCSTPTRSRPAVPTRSPSGSSCCSPPASRPSSPPAPPAASASTSQGFSGAAGGVVCSACEAGAFRLDQDAHDFLVGALGRPLADDARRPSRARSPRRSGRSTTRSSTTRTSGGDRSA